MRRACISLVYHAACVSEDTGRQSMLVYAICIINDHAEGTHNGRLAQHNAFMSEAGFRGHVCLCVRPLRMERIEKNLQNNKTFESHK